VSYGLRVWDASGALQLDITDRLTRFVGQYGVSFTTTSSEPDKYIYISGISNDGTWFVNNSNSNTGTWIEPGRVVITKLYSFAQISTTVLVFRV